MNTCKALDRHNAKLLSQQVGQLTPRARLYPVRPGPGNAVSLNFAKVRGKLVSCSNLQAASMVICEGG